MNFKNYFFLLCNDEIDPYFTPCYIFYENLQKKARLFPLLLLVLSIHSLNFHQFFLSNATLYVLWFDTNCVFLSALDDKI